MPWRSDGPFRKPDVSIKQVKDSDLDPRHGGLPSRLYVACSGRLLMGARKVGAALAVAAMLFPVAGQAADVAIGTISSGTAALVSRDGKVISAVPGMKLYSGDRLLTRDGGSANVTMANNCSVAVGSSAMLPMSNAGCAKSDVISFDQGRAGYPGSSSAFQSHPGGLWALYLALAAIWGSALYVALHHHHHHHNPPTSP
jgi:hypothetical protein